MCALLCGNPFLVGIITCRVGLQVQRFNSEGCFKSMFTWVLPRGVAYVARMLCGGCRVGCVGWGSVQAERVLGEIHLVVV